MVSDLLREYVREALNEAALDPGSAASKGLGLASFDMGAKKALVLFHVKKAAEAIVTSARAGRTSEDDYMNALEPTIVGFILGKAPEKGSSWNALMINSSAALKGYGPLMYDIAMSRWGRITPDRKSVSPAAEKVWSYYATKRNDVKRLQFDDVEDPRTSDPQDDAVIHPKAGFESPLNGAYEGASVNAGALEQNGHKFFLWAQASKLEKSKIQNALRYAGSGFFRKHYLST